MLSWWQHLPETINPIALSVGFFSLYWYALFFFGGVFVCFIFALYFVQREESPCGEETLLDVFLFLFLGAVIGGRIGYVLFYNLDLFLNSPLSIVSPYDFRSGVWIGISGMSYHGGLIGAIVALFLFTQKKKIHFWKMTDFIVLFVPVATVFGRLGNFFNGELYGRVTEKPWGMIFSDALPAGVLRHPSSLYEAFFEGIVLFCVLLFFRKKMPFPGALSCLYIAGYASVRFVGEYLREPDPQIGLLFGNTFSLGQIFSVVMFLLAGGVFIWLKHRNYDRIVERS